MGDLHRDPLFPDLDLPLPPLPQLHPRFFFNNSTQSAMNNNTPTQPSAPALTTAQAPMTNSGAAFISEHTMHDNDPPLGNECPICLDSYIDEQCLRITGIAGCTHRIGAKCLEEMLRTSSRDEKRCPLCRAVWIPSQRRVAPIQTHGLQESLTEEQLFRVRSRFLRVRTAHPQPVRVVAPPTQAQPPRPEPSRGHRAPQAPRAQESPNLIDLDSDSRDYETEVRNFQDFTRDVADIRDRAQNTRRNRVRHRSVNNVTTGNQDTGGYNFRNQVRRTNTAAGGGGGNGTFNRIMNARRGSNRPRPPVNDTSLPTNASGASNQSSVRQPSFGPLFEQTPPRTRSNSRTASLPLPASPLLPSMTADIDMDDDSFAGLSNYLNSGPSPTLHPTSPPLLHLPSSPLLHPTPSPILHPAEHRPQRSADVRILQRDLRRQETAIYALEATVQQRDAALLENERRNLAMRAIMRRHEVELEDLLRRQREELARLMTH